MTARTIARKAPTKSTRTFILQTAQDHRLAMPKEDNSGPPTSRTPHIHPPTRYTPHIGYGPHRHMRQYEKTTPTVNHKGVHHPHESSKILASSNTAGYENIIKNLVLKHEEEIKMRDNEIVTLNLDVNNQKDKYEIEIAEKNSVIENITDELAQLGQESYNYLVDTQIELA